MLKPKKHISRREIKEDGLVTAYFNVQKFIKKYMQQIQIGAIAVLVVVAVGVFMVRSKKTAESKAAGMLGVAEQYYYIQDYDKAIQELGSIVELYPGTLSAGRATFFMANAHFEKEEFDLAEGYYKDFIDDYRVDAFFAPSAMAGIAATYEAQGMYAEASEYFENAAQKYDDYFQAPRYLMDAARCYDLAGNKEMAKSMYQLVLDRYADSNASKDAKVFINTL